MLHHRYIFCTFIFEGKILIFKWQHIHATAKINKFTISNNFNVGIFNCCQLVNQVFPFCVRQFVTGGKSNR